MSKNSTEVVLCAMRPKTFYRASDIEQVTEVKKPMIYQALRELSLGGVVEKVTDGRRTVFLTKQDQLF